LTIKNFIKGSSGQLVMDMREKWNNTILIKINKRTTLVGIASDLLYDLAALFYNKPCFTNNTAKIRKGGYNCFNISFLNFDDISIRDSKGSYTISDNIHNKKPQVMFT